MTEENEIIENARRARYDWGGVSRKSRTNRESGNPDRIVGNSTRATPKYD